MEKSRSKLESIWQWRQWKMWHVNQEFRFYLAGNEEPLKNSEQGVPLHQSADLQCCLVAMWVKDGSGERTVITVQKMEIRLDYSKNFFLFLARKWLLRQSMVKKAQKWGKQGLKSEAWPTELSAPKRSKRPRAGSGEWIGQFGSSW